MKKFVCMICGYTHEGEAAPEESENQENPENQENQETNN